MRSYIRPSSSSQAVCTTQVSHSPRQEPNNYYTLHNTSTRGGAKGSIVLTPVMLLVG